MTESTGIAAADAGSRRPWRTALVGGLALCMLFTWLQWRAMNARAESLRTVVTQAAQMQLDADRIVALRAAPKSALSRTRPSDELLAQVEKALSAAGIDRQAWRDSVPAPAAAVAGTDYRRLTTRLYFDQVTLKQLVAFAHALEAADPTLRVRGLNLRAKEEAGNAYEADVGVAYLLYAPKGQ